MELGRRLCSVTPHEDIENGFPRRPIPYHLAIPDAGINEETGLIFFIDGFGGHPNTKYSSKNRPHFANRYNCIVVGVEYFDIGMKLQSKKDYRLAKDFIDSFEAAYNVRLPDLSQYSDLQVLELIAKIMANAKTAALHPSVQVELQPKDFYQSFGLLPALDCLQVAAEVLVEFSVNRERIFILGTSYGGYIGSLMAKLAPKTFQLVVDNSGFTQVSVENMVGVGYGYVRIFGCHMPVKTVGLWSDDSASPHFLNHHHREIRNLCIEAHLKASKTAYFCAHSEDDGLVPIEEKQKFKSIRKGKAKVFLEQVGADQIDGQLYKNLQHGMGASLRGLFDKAYNHYIASDPVLNDQTDFDLESEYAFPCSNGYSYRIKFTKDDVKLSLHPPE